MLFRVVIVLAAAFGTAIAAVVYPFLGLLALVFLNFGRPQDDRPNIVALHIPMMVLIAVLVGVLFRSQTTIPALIAALKRMRIMLVLTTLIALSVAAHYTKEAMVGLDDFLTLMVFCVITLTLVTTETRLRLYLGVLLASGLYVITTVIRNPRHMVEQIGGDQFVRVDMGQQMMLGATNYLALYMVILGFLCLSLLSAYKSAWPRILLLGFVATAGYVFFLANSRGASFALAGSTLVMWLTSKNKLKSAVIGIVVLGIFVMLAPDAYWDRLLTLSHTQDDSSSTGRMELWGIALSLIPQYPVLGVGFMNFTLHAYNSPHQAYLQIASEVGLPALLVYVVLLGSGINAALSARGLSSPERQGSKFIHAASLGILCAVLAVTIQGFTTGLAHREMVHVFICLAYCVRALAEQRPAEAEFGPQSAIEGNASEPMFSRPVSQS